MKLSLISTFAFLLTVTTICTANFIQKIDRGAYYEAIKSNRTADIDSQLFELTALPIVEKEAFEGALLMRKAGLVTTPAEKLKLFKAGRIKLETALMKDSSNVEFHFLRLIIQEHAPKIVKYNKQIISDKKLILEFYNSQKPLVKKAISDYSKSSRILRPEDLN